MINDVTTYEQLIYQMCQKVASLVVMTAENRAAIRNIADKLNERFIDVGICEMTLAGAATGLALRGKKPIIHALAMFLTGRAFEFIRTDIGYPKLPVKLIGYIPGILSTANGATHQAIDDVGLMSGIPGMNVFAPADIEDLLICLPQIIESDEPYYVRYVENPKIVNHKRQYDIGKAELIKDGINVTILCYGPMLKQGLLASKKLEELGLSVRLYNLRTVKPIDTDAILNAAIETQLIVTLEDHFESTGLYSIVCSLLNRNRIFSPVLPMGLKDKYFKPAVNIDEILYHEGLAGSLVANKIYDEFKRSR
jgi:transketolase